VSHVEPAEEPSPLGRPTRLTGPEARRLHLVLAGGLTLCVGAFCIELLRALGGNTLSWLYVFEWPLFAGFGIYMWWTLLNGGDGDRSHNHGAVASRGDAAEPDEADAEALRAWNTYLREMRDAESEDQAQTTCASDPAESPLKRS
jgi:hypothetical protein